MTVYPLYSWGNQGKISTTAQKFHPTQPLTEWLGQKVSCRHDTSTAWGRGVQGHLRRGWVCTRRSLNHAILCYHGSITTHCFHMNRHPPQKQCERKVVGFNPILSQILTEAKLFLLIYLETNFYWKFFTAPMPLIHFWHFPFRCVMKMTMCQSSKLSAPAKICSEAE